MNKELENYPNNMSEAQIKQILKKLEEQNVENRQIHDLQTKQLKEISAKVDPMYTLFTNATGFNRISVWILKGLAIIGTAIAALYIIIEFFKKISRQ